MGTYNDQYSQPVASFMLAAGQDVNVAIDRDTPTDLIDLRIRLMDDELDEVIEAINLRDPVQVAAELADLLYTVFGTAIAFGVPIGDVFAAIAHANMSKIDPVTGKPFEVVNGKVRKGPEYADPKPVIEEIMRMKLVTF
jgi:predicted HAD superfamily Cof-like phosphohydrolase